MRTKRRGNTILILLSLAVGYMAAGAVTEEAMAMGMTGADAAAGHSESSEQVADMRPIGMSAMHGEMGVSNDRETSDETSDDETSEAKPAHEVEPEPLTEEELLKREVHRLLDDLRSLRHQLAETQLAKAEMERELDELRQFIADHDQLGRDFEEYQRIREIKQREQRQRELREARERYEQEREKRLQRQQEARDAAARRRAAEREQRRYQQHGFEPLGLDVYVGRMAYQYRIRDTLRTRITYDPFFGFYTRRDFRDEIDYTEMTISGAIINASDEVRNIGIAITFFDERGNQVGHEIVQVNNARTDVPYPFTSTVSMALDRPFATSSSYVLFADPALLE
jgi:hypothetical protein